jgi:hypothetical protein
MKTSSLSAALAAISFLAASTLPAQTPSPSTTTFTSIVEVVRFDSGTLSNTTGRTTTLVDEEFAFDQSHWLQLRFGALTDLPRGSFLRMTSAADGGTQRLDADSLRIWSGQSAFFNGGAVKLELVAPPGAKNARVVVDTIVRGLPSQFSSICPPTDTRAASNDARIGRLVDGGTGFLVYPNVLLTSGTASASFTQSIVEFDVPLSSPTGQIVRADPDDQYPISVVARDLTGPGQDWAVCEVFPNSNTGLLPSQASGAGVFDRGPVPGSASSQTLRVAGFSTTVGAPLPAARNFTQLVAEGPLQQVGTADLQYAVDTNAGGAGSPVIDVASGDVIGIHTNGDCSSGGLNVGTRIDNPALFQALVPFDPNTAATATYGTGCPGPAAFYEVFNPAQDLNGVSLELASTGSGFRVDACTSNCFDPNFGTDLGLTDEALSPTLLLGFSLALPGGVTTPTIRISSNGWIDLSGGVFFDPDFSPSVAELLSQPARLAVLWDDLDPGAGGAVYYRNGPGFAIVTFDNVAQFGEAGSSNSVQVQFFSTGVIKIAYGASNTSTNPLVGYSPGSVADDPGSRDLTALPFGTGSGAPALELSATSPPILGGATTLQLTNLPAGALGASLYAGFTPQNLNLGFVGAPDCFFLTGGDIAVGMVLSGTSASLPFPVPADPMLSGVSIYTQALGIGPGLSRFGFATSNGLELRFGN